MRVSELLIEANLSPRDFYKRDRLISFINRLKKKESFIDNKTHQKVIIPASRAEIKELESILDYYDQNGDLPKDKMTKLMPNVIGGVALSSIFKDIDLGGKGGSKGEESGDVTKFNIGPAVETWKAIGLFAKLIHRSNSPVTIEDLMSVKQDLESSVQLEQKPGSSAETAVARKLLSVPDLRGTVKDTISIKVDVGLGSWQRAMAAGPQDPGLWGRIQGIVGFLNENRALQRYSQIFATNGRVDPIKVAVVGGAGKKTDVKTSYLDPDTDYKKGKQIVGMSFSLKAGNAGVSQSPGTTEEGVRIMFRSLSLPDSLADQAMADSAYNPKVGVDSQKSFKARLLSLTKIMKVAAYNLDNELKSLNDKGEKIFVHNFINELKKAVTAGEGLIFVEFNAKGTYDYLNPHTLHNLVSYVDLESKIIIKTTPYIYIYDKNSGRNLAHVRLEVQKSGRLILKYELDELITLAREATEAKNNEKPQQAVQAPVKPAIPASKKSAPVAPKLKASTPTIGQPKAVPTKKTAPGIKNTL